jgi:hypothetical protein
MQQFYATFLQFPHKVYYYDKATLYIHLVRLPDGLLPPFHLLRKKH